MNVLTHFKIGRYPAIIMAGLLALALVACGSDSPASTDTSSDGTDDGPPIVRESDNFSHDSFVGAGWKSSKEFSTETVPESTAIWYGFYKSQDVEIRFYGSHADALGPGIESANAAVGRVSNANLEGNAIFASGQRAQYADFMVAGNAVILCQSDITICAELVDNIP